MSRGRCEFVMGIGTKYLNILAEWSSTWIVGSDFF